MLKTWKNKFDQGGRKGVCMKCSAVVLLPLGINYFGSVNFVPEKTEDILHYHHWFPCKMTSEKC